MKKSSVIIAAISGAMAVALGAMAAHLLKSKLETGLITEANLQTFETAARYQMYISMVVLVLGIGHNKFDKALINKAIACFIIGIVFFSGSLYLIATAGLIGLNNIKWLGPITPFGGLLFIAGWLLVAMAAYKAKISKNDNLS